MKICEPSLKLFLFFPKNVKTKTSTEKVSFLLCYFFGIIFRDPKKRTKNKNKPNLRQYKMTELKGGGGGGSVIRLPAIELNVAQDMIYTVSENDRSGTGIRDCMQTFWTKVPSEESFDIIQCSRVKVPDWKTRIVEPADIFGFEKYFVSRTHILSIQHKLRPDHDISGLPQNMTIGINVFVELNGDGYIQPYAYLGNKKLSFDLSKADRDYIRQVSQREMKRHSAFVQRQREWAAVADDVLEKLYGKTIEEAITILENLGW